MGIFTGVLINHSRANLNSASSVGEYLRHADLLKGTHGVRMGILYLGEYSGAGSLPILFDTGRVSSPKHGISQTLTRTWPAEHNYTILSVSGDSCRGLESQMNLGTYLSDAINKFKRDPFNSTYLEPYGQAIEIVTTFSSNDVGIAVLEGGGSWVVGKEATPDWSRAARNDHRKARDALELTLALKQGVKVNLSSAKNRTLAIECF